VTPVEWERGPSDHLRSESERPELGGTLEQACRALASLVRMEYPSHLTLADVAQRWGEGITPDQVKALRWFERQVEK
jgi:hypothetical protein